ncbi:hypothetical protein [Nocardia australiensis]|uniref:hypothetical protein n=1 Tax=Nocardia australiensis TaxID=2887191 RepID=UPI001D13A045|nr:hypothetical protein [Nocardia australiensis]
MLFRPTTEADLERVVEVIVEEPVGWIEADRYQDELRQGMYRPASGRPDGPCRRPKPLG